ncbi:hypothetical protein H0B42_00210 [Rhodococcus aetherivorans]|nr:hypothetical protein [Rhodococcus aetherivorans]
MLNDFGEETITDSSHIEKLALIRPGVGRDMISDFTTNLIKHYLLRFTETFASEHVAQEQRRIVHIPRAVFNYETRTWMTRTYELPWTNGDFIILTPIDLLTKDDTWINKTDMLRSFDALPGVVDDDQLRADVSQYLTRQLSKNPTDREIQHARAQTLLQFPELIDCYIKLKEDAGDQAVATSRNRIDDTQRLLRNQVQAAARDLAAKTDLFSRPWTSFDEAMKAVETFKFYVENQDGWRVINRGNGKPFANENEVQGFFGLLLQESRFDVNREANNGRGPVDFKISAGLDKTLIEFKLAKSSSLERNLDKQIEIYEAANKTKSSITVIICYTAQDTARATRAMKKLGLDKPDSKPVIIVDACSDNKVSASKA